MKIPQLARYNNVVFKSYMFVMDNIAEFPIDLYSLIHKKGWRLMTYDQLARKNNCSIAQIEKCFGNDAYSVYNCDNGKYTIAYNTHIKSKQRINFSLAHEIGHIVLEHLRDFEHTSAKNDNITKAEYRILENEANCFARNILSPAPLIISLNNIDMLFKSTNIFETSFKASAVRINLLNNDLYYLNDLQIENMQKIYKRKRICKKCLTDILDENDKYCFYCGNDKIIKGDGFTMKKYKGVDALSECPNCENVDFLQSDKYCIICGQEFHNHCTNLNCGIGLPSNARYCKNCGSASTYFSNGILQSWDSIPFEIVSNDDELPF